jgi:DNA polymerase I-like protein with 3'-5' exonuclease and polymerase domains
MSLVTLDFETEAIDGNPMARPPRPVGLAIYLDGQEPTYVTDWDRMAEFLSVYFGNTRYSLLFHNGWGFDIPVATRWFGVPTPNWTRVHDTLFLSFISDPYSPSLHLKDLADRYLDFPPEEQDELHAWILANVAEATPKTAGAYICRAPVPLVAKYAKGDVLRTRQLFDHLHPSVPSEPYDRERRLAPKLTESSQIGIRVDRGRLQSDIEVCGRALSDADTRIFTALDAEPFNIDSGIQLADALEKADAVHTWRYTPKGRKSTSKDNLLAGLRDPSLLSLLVYRSTMSTCLGTFMTPWEGFSQEDGRIHTSWNQVANDEHGHSGTRTGRLSSSRPNFQNIPNVFKHDIPQGLPPLPNMRDYLLPEEGHLWIKRDFSSQEIRILAHFEDGTLMEAYRSDPFFDPHEQARQMINVMIGILYDRKDVKITGFSIIYGAGAPGLALQLGRSRSEAFEIRTAYLKAMPGVDSLAAATRLRGKSGGHITTWGGRPYYAEKGKPVNGVFRSFEYKLLNYLIQGSAADQTKEVINDWWEEYKQDAVFMATVHDEINASAPAESWQYEMTQLRHAMDQELFDVPMRSEGFVGETWGSLKEIKREHEYSY